jgi:hypothetical protein
VDVAWDRRRLIAGQKEIRHGNSDGAAVGGFARRRVATMTIPSWTEHR